MAMTREEAIMRLEHMRKDARVVLDSGFGTHPGECDLLYRKRVEMAEIALEALREQEKNRWIPVTERLPEEDTRVLVWVGENDCSFPIIDTDRIHTNRWVRWNNYITYWMPLPEPPKEVQK